MRRFFALGSAEAVRTTLWNALFWWLTILYMELLLHVLFFGGFSASVLYIVGFTGAAALLLSGLLGFLPVKANRIVSMVLVCLLSVVYCSQIVYEGAFGTMYSMSQIAMGGAAVTSFWRETLQTMWAKLPQLLLMLLPIPATAWLLRRDAVFAVSRDWLRLAVLLVAALLQFVSVSCLPIGGTGDYTNYDFYYSDRATTDQTADRFGLLTTMRLEFFGEAPSGNTQETPPAFELPIEPVTPETPEETTPETEKIAYNTLEIDFEKLNSLTDDEQVLALNQYIASLTGTKQNQYTGMLSDYNLITLCAESFSAGAIHPELTPTLYKLANEGFVFRNFYNSYPNNTTDGEYSFCLGLWPDTTRIKEASSFYTTRNSYMPYALGTIFQEQKGVKTYAYHNYTGSFYGRDETHPNMGYACKFSKAGMNFSSAWPSSDLEMMEQSIGDYIHSGEQFHAYYMTFSGHISYNTESNQIAYKNYHLVKDLPYSEASKCYLACNIELDKALAYLLEELDAAGILEKTAIVLAADHHPYGLNDRRYGELLGCEINAANKYEAPLIFWVGGMEAPVYVDAYMCSVDILPTILNLWGFRYDSRLLAGTDALSDGEHMAILRDQSFFTDKVWFNASTGEATWLVDESTVDPNYLENHIKMVKNRFAVSSSILNEAYYNFLFEKGAVSISNDRWMEGWIDGGPANKEEDPAEPTIIPTEPTVAPTEPAVTPTEPAVTPTEPAVTPTEPAVTPTEPTDTPTEPTAAPTEPTPTTDAPQEAPPEETEPAAP